MRVSSPSACVCVLLCEQVCIFQCVSVQLVCVLVRAVQSAAPAKVTECLSAPWEERHACVCVLVFAT